MWDQQHPPPCPQCPQHVLTGSDSAVSYSWFCEAFGFPAGPAGSNSLLLFYELWSSAGVLVQSGRATGCAVMGRHPENLLFDHRHGYLWSVLEACEEVGYVLLYSNYTPCQEPARQCAQSLVSFLQAHPWVRLDLLFSQLYNTQPGKPHYQENQAGLHNLASIWPRFSLSPISGAAWGYLLRRFVPDAPPSVLQHILSPGRVEADRQNAAEISAITGVGPVFLDLSQTTPIEPGRGSNQHQTPTHPVTLLPPPHLPPPVALSQLETLTPAPPHPVNVVRHIRMPPPRHPRTALSPSSTFSSLLPSLLQLGRPVEVVQVTEREAPNVSQSQHRLQKKKTE
ncbi:putative C-_U-editing enzyme APOBEC-4 [Centroberyx gerrardi]